MRQGRDGSVGCVDVGVGLSVVGSVDGVGGVVNLDLSLLFPVFIVSRPLVAIPETFINYINSFRTDGGDYCGDDCGDDGGDDGGDYCGDDCGDDGGDDGGDYCGDYCGDDGGDYCGGGL